MIYVEFQLDVREGTMSAKYPRQDSGQHLPVFRLVNEAVI